MNLSASAVTAPAAPTAGQAGYQAQVATQAGASCAWTLTNGSQLSPANGPSIRFAAGTDLSQPCPPARGPGPW